MSLNPNLTQEEKAEIIEGAEKVKLEARAKAVRQCDALIDAGWRYELPEIVNRREGKPPSHYETEPWQWYWRRPPRRKGKGMKFWSTNQAYTHLRKSKPGLPEIYT
jgi:hypothetical protein